MIQHELKDTEIDIQEFVNQAPNSSLLITPEEEGIIAQEHGKPTYIYDALCGEYALRVVGTPHIFVSDTPIIGAFADFNPDFVFVEGSGSLPDDVLDIETAAALGEPKLTLYLAAQHKIPAISWDMPFSTLLKESVEATSREAVLGWVVAQGFKHYVKSHGVSPESPEQLLAFIQDRINLEPVFDDLPTAADFDAACLKYSGKPITSLSADLAEYLASPRYTGPTNQVNRFMISQRDPNAVQKIFDEFKRHKRIFVVAGQGHAITWKPVFEDLFDSVEQLD